MSFEIELVWPMPTALVQQQAIRFWSDEAALSYAEATGRARQLVAVARDPDGRITAAATAVRQHVDHLGVPCFFYRCFVGRAHRARGLYSQRLGRRLLLASHRLLNERFLAGEDDDVLGLYLQLDNAKLQRVRREAVWETGDVRFVFVGVTPHGRHCRVAYFRGARLPV